MYSLGLNYFTFSDIVNTVWLFMKKTKKSKDHDSIKKRKLPKTER